MRAIDQDLSYSDPAQVALTITPDRRDARITQLETDLQKRNRELVEANQQLERRVQERTAELEAKNTRLGRLLIRNRFWCRLMGTIQSKGNTKRCCQ